MSKSNAIIIRPNGPLQCEGDITLQDTDGNCLSQANEAWLCRCGWSKDKPFCDGAHKDCGFADPAVFEDLRGEPLESETGPLTITIKPNSMLSVRGPVTIRSRDGKSVSTRNRAALCRCGESGNKPFCDASHHRCGFVG